MTAVEVRQRPLSPSIRREVAEYLMVADPRCAHDLALAASRVACPRCQRSLADYLSVSPQEWPA